jgi:glycerol dehydrogenase
MVDSQIVAQAPVRLFASGMSDGLATLVEVESTLCSLQSLLQLVEIQYDF